MYIQNSKLRSLVCVAHLPEEIVEEIWAKLPVKSLLRFRCVSKSGRLLIDTKIFINKHLQNSKRRGVVNKYCSIIDDPSCWKMNLPIKNPLEGGWIIGCCNGVLCILKKGRFFLSNPATRSFIRLPTFNFIAEALVWYGWKEIRCGFGWDEESDAYKLFVITNNDDGVSLCKVYSSKTNAWEKVECGRVGYCGAPDHYNVGVLASGKIHWVPQRGYNSNYVDCIEYLDVKSEVFGRIELPSEPEVGVGRWWLSERDGCLYALYSHKDDDKGTRRLERKARRMQVRFRRKRDRAIQRARERGGEEEAAAVELDYAWVQNGPEIEEEEEEAESFDVWVMEEYGVKESWVKKKTNIPILKSTLDYQRYVYVESLILPIGDTRCCDKKKNEKKRSCSRRRKGFRV